MAGGELRTAFVLASRTPSGPGGESDSRPPSAKRQTDGARGAAAWRHRHQEREWFAHIDDHVLDIMMSSAQTCVQRFRNEGELSLSSKQLLTEFQALFSIRGTRRIAPFSTRMRFWRDTRPT